MHCSGHPNRPLLPDSSSLCASGALARKGFSDGVNRRPWAVLIPVDSQLHWSQDGDAAITVFRKDGVPVDVEIQTVFVAPGDGRTTVAIVSELGRHRVAEQRLSEIERELALMSEREKKIISEMRTETRFRELLEAAPDAIIEVDRDGRIMFC